MVLQSIVSFASLIGLLSFGNVLAQVLIGTSIPEIGFLLAVLVARVIYLLPAWYQRQFAQMTLWLFVDAGFLLLPAVLWLLELDFAYTKNLPFAYYCGCCYAIALAVMRIAGMALIQDVLKPPDVWCVSKFTCLWIMSVIVGTSLGASLLAKALGIGVMGIAPQGVLPFKMQGLINEYRHIGVPVILAIVFDILVSCRRRRAAVTLLAYTLAWGLLEMVLRISKGALLMTLMPIALTGLYQRKLNVRLLGVVVAAFCVTVAAYLVVPEMRARAISGGGGSILNDFNQGFRSHERLVSSTLGAMYTRVFKAGVHFAKMRDYLKHPWMQNNFYRVNAAGGPAAFHTHVIDGFPVGAVHSSGISGFSDAFLIGGVAFSCLTLGVFFVLAMFIDRGFILGMRVTSSGRAAGLCFFISLLVGGLWQELYKFTSIIAWVGLIMLYVVLHKRFAYAADISPTSQPMLASSGRRARLFRRRSTFAR